MAMWIVPLLLGGAAIWIAARSWQVSRWHSAVGTVLEIARDEAADAWIVTFGFDEPGGWTSEATLTTEDRHAFALGERVPLRRDPMDPAGIETLHPRRVATVVALLAGVFALWTLGLILG